MSGCGCSLACFTHRYHTEEASPEVEGTSHTRRNAERGAQRPQRGVEAGGGGREALRHEALFPSHPHTHYAGNN